MQPDTRLQNVELTMVRDPVHIQNGKSSQVCNFAIRKVNSYTDADGMFIEKQPLDMFCSTFSDDVINTLKNLKVGASVHLAGYIEPVWRVYIANGQPGGITKDANGNTLIVPEPGQSPMQLASGDQIYPDAQPFRLNDKLVNACVMPGASLNVVSITPATQIATGDIGEASSFAAIQQEQQAEQQASLNKATATAPTNGAAAQDPPFGAGGNSV